MELKRYLYPLRRWWWLILASAMIAGTFSFVATLRQPPFYQARTTLVIGRAIEDPNPSANQFWLSQQLAESYADIANRELIRGATMNALGINWLPDYRARALPNSQLIEIAVTDTNPERAQIVANELANQLILQSPTGSRAETLNRREFLNQQLDALEIHIRATEDEVQKLQEELGNLVSARQITDTQNQIAALQAKLTTLQGNYANLLANTQGGALNVLSVIEPASLPTRPIGPSRAITVFLAAAIGLALAAGAAYLLEYLDDTLKTTQEVQRVMGSSIIGFIAEMDGNEERVYVAENPRHPIAESFRTIRTNLDFAGVDGPLETIYVTSAEAGSGKSSVAMNLAAVMALGEKNVVILDADLRRPRVHCFLGISNDIGLADIFLGHVDVNRAMRNLPALKLRVITAGASPPNPTELLGSKKMDQILAEVSGMADVVIIDGPPFLVADALVLAAKVDGVLAVVRPGYTHKPMAEAMVEQIQRAGARLAGVVLNRIPNGAVDYYAGYHYALSSYYRDAEEQNDGWFWKNLRIFGRTQQKISNGFKPKSNSIVDRSDR